MCISHLITPKISVKNKAGLVKTLFRNGGTINLDDNSKFALLKCAFDFGTANETHVFCAIIMHLSKKLMKFMQEKLQ